MQITGENVVRNWRFNLTESAASTYTQQEVQTNLSLDSGLIAVIHQISFYLEASALDTPAANGLERAVVQLTRQTKTGILVYDDADLIEKFALTLSRSTAIGTDAGPLYWLGIVPVVFNYSPGLLYANSSIFFGILSTAGTPITGQCRVSFTLNKISERLFFQAAQSLG